MTTQNKRRNAVGRRVPDIMTTRKKRRNSVAVRDDETMTTCSCGVSFLPKRKKQVHCSGECRRKAYEQTDKAKTRRARYWKTQKGLDTRQRYVATGASAENSRTWRERQNEYREQFLEWVRKNPDAPMEQIFGEDKKQIPLHRSFQVFVSLSHAGYRYKHPLMKRLSSYLKQVGMMSCSNAEHSTMLEQGKTHCDQCQMGEIRMHGEMSQKE